MGVEGGGRMGPQLDLGWERSPGPGSLDLEAAVEVSGMWGAETPVDGLWCWGLGLSGCLPLPLPQHGQDHADTPVHTAGRTRNHSMHPLPRHSATKHILHATIWGWTGPRGGRALGLRCPSPWVPQDQF